MWIPNLGHLAPPHPSAPAPASWELRPAKQAHGWMVLGQLDPDFSLQHPLDPTEHKPHSQHTQQWHIRLPVWPTVLACGCCMGPLRRLRGQASQSTARGRGHWSSHARLPFPVLPPSLSCSPREMPQNNVPGTRHSSFPFPIFFHMPRRGRLE